MSLKKTLALALILAAALGYIFYVEIPQGIEKEKSEKLFANMPRERIAEIKVVRGQEQFSLQNLKPEGTDSPSSDKSNSDARTETQDIGAHWQFNNIKGARLESGVFTGLTSALADLKIGDALPASDLSSDLGVYGLDTPEVVISVKGLKNSGENYAPELRFGKRNDFLKQRYLQVHTEGAETKIYLVPDALFLAANKPAADFRAKSFISFVDTEVLKLNSSNATESYQVERVDLATNVPIRRSPWMFTGAEGDLRASEEVISELFRELRNLRAKEYVDGEEVNELSKFGFTDKSPRIELTYKNNASSPLVVRFHAIKEKDTFGRGPGTYISSSELPSLVFIEQDLSAKLFKGRDELREKMLFRFMTADATRVQIHRLDGQQSDVERNSEGLWMLRSEDGTSAPADTVFVDELLGNLAQLKADRFPIGSEDFGLSAAKGKVSVTVKNAEPSTATLLIGNRVGATENGDFYVGVLQGAETEVKEPFIVKSSEIEKILPRREVLSPVPTATPTVSPTSGATTAEAAASSVPTTQPTIAAVASPAVL